jgi:hypothetical protein
VRDKSKAGARNGKSRPSLTSNDRDVRHVEQDLISAKNSPGSSVRDKFPDRRKTGRPELPSMTLKELARSPNHGVAGLNRSVPVDIPAASSVAAGPRE